ncbi:MAG TPA: HD domain-containing phosphohydrolase [Solirubrobacteraceae bacterium]|jgi:PAS domain S-box-containing protein/putative nucleotidyltransferase with HDIG domain|nr:HD domain-containing phosphohydrolase [Solirubrobacteraceae bacterium]
MLSHPHLPRLRAVRGRGWPVLSSRTTVAVAAVLFAVVFALRTVDSNPVHAEGVLYLVPISLLALRFGLRGGLGGALLTVVLVVVWGKLSSNVQLTTEGYVSRTVALVLLGTLLGLFVDHRRNLESEIMRYYDASLDLLATADLNGRFIRVNPAWERALGHSAEVLCSKPFIDFVHPDDRETTVAETHGVADSHDTIGFRNRYRTADGSYRWLEWSASRSLSEGVIHAVARDVTVQHEAEEQLADNAKTLEKLVAERTRELDDARAETLRQLAIAAEYRDDETYQHTERVGHVAAKLARGLGLPAGQVTLLRHAAPLHDVGKLAIPDCILLKPGRLTPEEFEVMKTHAELGARLLSSGGSRVLQTAAVIAATHHERWDGTGYPKGLSGEGIPLVGRIVAVADVFDALTHDRPYKSAWSLQRACAEIERSAGSQFDPRVVAAFLALRSDLDTLNDDVEDARPSSGLAIFAGRPVVAIPRRRGDLLEHVDLHAPRAETGQRRRIEPAI